jgi:hypothetical protein
LEKSIRGNKSIAKMAKGALLVSKTIGFTTSQVLRSCFAVEYQHYLARLSSIGWKTLYWLDNEILDPLPPGSTETPYPIVNWSVTAADAWLDVFEETGVGKQ